jgi:hypothetical protein
MKAAQSSLPLSAILLIGFSQSAVAGPQSLLDPYATVKAPTKKATPAAKRAAPEKAIPQSVTIGGGALPPLQRNKPKAATTSVPAARSGAAPTRAAAPASKPIASSAPSSEGEEGFIAGTKQIFQGIGTATKGAVVTPAKKLGSAVAGGAKGSGGFFASGASKVSDGFKAMGGGFKTVGGKIKDGTVAVGGKIKDGSAAAGHAIVAAPKALIPGSKGEGAEKIAEKPAPKKDLPGTPIIDDSKKELVNAPLPKLSPIKTESGGAGGDGIGSKLIGMPKTAVKGLGAAAAKTGEGAKKVAGAPIGFFGKLNPFKKNDADIKTAATQKPQQIASPSTETPIK